MDLFSYALGKKAGGGGSGEETKFIIYAYSPFKLGGSTRLINTEVKK